MSDKVLASVLSDVVEKSMSLPKEFKPIGSEIPKVEKINLTELKNSTGLRKKSLFAQNLENKGKLKSFYPLDRVKQPNSLLQSETIKSMEKKISSTITNDKTEKLKQIITGDSLGNKKDAEQIHLENLERLSQMKPEEILQEQQKLIQQLDPKIVSFIRKRNKNDQQAEQMEIDTNNKPKSSTKPDEEILNELPIKPDKKWLHMDKIEYEKLEWMLKPKNPVNNENEKGKSARFDFQGNVMSNTEEIPVTKALHHHGNEPDLAGYTLDELFHLSRSKFNQQRVLALQTIANILAKCHQGSYYDVIKSGSYTALDDFDTDINDKHNLLNQLIDGGILYLLRWSLDDQTESIINVSLIALKNLLQPTDQENILDSTFDLYRGYEMPSLFPFSELVDDISGEKQLLYKVDKNLNLNERKELDELSDEEYVKHDLIKGLFRMNLMARFYYLLDKYQPTLTSNQIINNIFMILYRCLRHSTEIAYDFTEKFSNLVDLIVRNFMPKFLSSDQLSNNSSVIVNITLALKLFRIICSSGSNLAFKMCKKYDLNNRLISYIAIYDPDTKSNDLNKLQIESIRLFKILTIYHSDYSQPSLETLSNSFELILKQFNNLITKFNSNKTHILQAYVSFFNSLVLNSFDDDKNLKLKYDMTTSVNSIVQSFTFNQFKAFFNNKPESQQFDLNLISVCINFISDYLDKIVYGSFFVFNSLINLSKKPSDLFIENLFIPLQQNETNSVNQLKFDDLIMSKLVSNSTYASDNTVADNLKKLTGNNLSYLPTIMNDMNDSKQLGCYSFLIAYFKLYSLCFKLDNKFFNDLKTTNMLLTNAYLKSYLKLFINKNEMSNDSFIRVKYENQMVFYCLKLAFNLINFDDFELQKGLKDDEKRFFYLVSLNLMHKLKQGDEYYAQDLLSTCVFNTNLWSTYLTNTQANILIKHFEKMTLTSDRSFPDFNYNENESIKIDKSFITNLESVHIYDSLNQIKLTYLESNHLLNTQLVDQSRKLFDLNKLNHLLKSKFYSNKSLLELDWIYSPIKFHLKRVQSKSKPISNSDDITSKLIQTVSNSLKFIYLLEAYFNDYLDLRLDLTTRYVHLLYVYLFESQVFLDKQIETYLYLIYYKFSIDKRRPLENLNLNQQIADIISFYDFYQTLLQHYDSTSFGDYLFSLFIIVPLQQQYSVKYRQLFWSDFFHLFKYIKFSTDKTKLLIPLTNFVQPYEKSLNMIRLYSQILLDGDDFKMISNSKFGYSILIAHLNSFIFEHANNLELQVEFNFKKLLVTRFMSLTNEKLKHDVVYFKCLNPVTYEQEFYDELPAIRIQWLNQLNQ